MADSLVLRYPIHVVEIHVRVLVIILLLIREDAVELLGELVLLLSQQVFLLPRRVEIVLQLRVDPWFFWKETR